MFDSLDEQMKHDLQTEDTPKARVLKYIIISGLAFVAVGGMAAAYQFVR